MGIICGTENCIWYMATKVQSLIFIIWKMSSSIFINYGAVPCIWRLTWKTRGFSILMTAKKCIGVINDKMRTVPALFAFYRVTSDRNRVTSDRNRVTSDRNRVTSARTRVPSVRTPVKCDRNRVQCDRNTLPSYGTPLLSNHSRVQLDS